MFIFATSDAPLLTSDLCLPFGYIVNPGGSQLEETLLPRLLAVFFEVQHPLQIGHDDGRSTEVLLDMGGGREGS